ncbi:MAG TPA: ribonuclease P protein component 4 [Candidatus Nanoarchaeia archaeon]|nr:ribonuclease P protein component 4 [Candidatus Nanoarchaeia archaeon]
MPKKQSKTEALQIVVELFKDAEKQFKQQPAKAHLAVKKARRIAMKHKLRMPRELKRRFCKHCYHYLQPGVNARVRVHDGKVIITCWECKHIVRIPIKYLGVSILSRGWKL